MLIVSSFIYFFCYHFCAYVSWHFINEMVCS